jgi:Tol biopolymer transport system component
MTVAAGTKLGSYEVVAPIGAGGMGEVYQAHDTKLGRDVAIKVLPEAFAHDTERLARFQREAKMLASLNHPNIATIHGLEQSNGTSYLVMELVSGETLADRVKREGAVPVEEALKIAVQIAEALEAAHEKGIIHRDLKPANVKVTPEGKVKVLDFGLAKAFAGEVADSNPSQSPTLSAVATMQGVLLGTAAYMSPEQARGKAVDKRTDIWAFGCVLYELLTGKQAFQGETVTEILAAVLKGEPEWQALHTNTPIKIRDLLRRCLQKDVNKRCRDAGDVRIEIEEALAAPATAEATAPTKGIHALGWRTVPLIAVGTFIAAVIVGLAAWNLKPAPPQPKPVLRLTITLPPGEQLAALDSPAIALSPDGTQLAYVAIRGGPQQIYLRALNNLESRPIAGTEGANSPFFSPDGQWLGFFASGKLKKVSVSGGAAVILGGAWDPHGASWGSQGTIVFSPSTAGVLQRVPDAGGTPQPLTRLEKSDVNNGWPEFLPGGKAVLFAASTISGNWTSAQVVVHSVGTGEQRRLLQGTHPRFAPSGHLLYAQGGTLMAVAFNSQRLEVTGAAVPVVEGVLQSVSKGDAQYSISATGSLVYVSGGVQSTQRRMVWVDRKGVEQALPAPARPYRYTRISADGQRVATGIEESENHIWLYDLLRETLTRWTFEGGVNIMGAWTPDGKRIAFQSDTGGPQNIYWQLANGGGGLERLTTSEYINAPNSWSPDGQALAFIEIRPDTGYDILVLRLSDRKVQPFLRTRFNESAPRFSPDGRWLAYISDESGRFEVYVQPYPGPGGKWQVSTDGGTEPVWNPNGRELFYREGDKMMAVDVTTQPSFSAGKPKMLFEGPYLPTPVTFPNYDVSPDGQRFLMLKSVDQSQAAPTQINVVLNWFEELKRRVPPGK